MINLGQELLVYFGINCYQCKKEKSVHKLTPKELIYMGFNAYNVKNLEIQVCEKCYEEVIQIVSKTEQGATQWQEIIEQEQKTKNTSEIQPLIGLKEFSEMLGWSKQALSMKFLRQRKGRKVRNPLPEPVQILAATPVWTQEQVEEYKKQLATSEPD
ncbi:hypothetical protein [Lysinibacillus sp. OL1]|uniref:hypothetical protein n=1 Tax=Lysinibacillus sp. OL1 TaxID=2517243 RepID=UPI00103CA85C|nr:hypothetical protein [Lysinibacillus sp. OL1]TBV85486.1 hypothetical protein EW028_21280 [Lysinibacillus sp. OL1]